MDAVLSGCLVVADSPNAMTVTVQAGSALFADVITAITSRNPSITTAHATLPRVDLVSLHSDNTVVVTAGTAAANPTTPALPAGNVPVGIVYVPAAATTIGEHNIGDRRIFGYGLPQNVGLIPQTAPAALTDNSGGAAADGTIGAVAATASAVVGGSSPTAAQVDTGIALAVSTIVTGVNAANKELATEINALRTALIASKILTA